MVAFTRIHIDVVSGQLLAVVDDAGFNGWPTVCRGS
jgi:hypothetical protein